MESGRIRWCKKGEELTKKAPKNATVTIKPETVANCGSAALFLKGLTLSNGLVLPLVVEVGVLRVETELTVIESTGILPLPPPLLVLKMVLRAVVEVPVGVVGVVVTPPESRQVALPDASRAQVVPGRQQKFSPGHSMVVGSAHPRFEGFSKRSQSYHTGAHSPDMVVQVLPRGQHPISPLVAVKHTCRNTE